jgi:putative ABC transport system permease protein
MYRAFKQAFKILFANPVRTILTTAGIMIGIATVIMVLSAGAGFRSLIDAQLQAYGTNTLFIETRVPPTTKNRNAGAMSADTSRAGSAVAITTLKNRDLTDIKTLGNVVNDYGMVVGQKVVSYRNVAKSVLFYGASADRFQIDKSTLKSGRFFTAAEDAGAAPVAILGSQLADDLFGQSDPLGQLVRLGDTNFQVIGVYNSLGALSGGNDEMLYIPLVTAQKKILGIDYLLMAVVQVKDINLSDSTAENIRITLRHNHNITDSNKDDFLVETQAQAMGTFNTIFNGITILLIAIAAISLVVGGVGIMNIMYVVVTERTAEIGLKKALGAKDADIMLEFLVESVLVTALGGVIGIIFGALLGWLVAVIAVANGLSWTFSVPSYAIAIGVGVSAVIGISFGVFPALSAAKLDPIEALSHE